MVTTQKLGLYKIEDNSRSQSESILEGVMISLSIPFTNGFRETIEEKIVISVVTSDDPSWSGYGYSVSGIKLHFTHESNRFRSVRRIVKIIDKSINLDNLQSKINEMLKLYDECEAKMAEQERMEELERDRLAQLLEECNSLGVQGRDRFGAIQVDRTIESLGVSLKIQGLTPDQARAIVKLLADNT